MADPPRSFEEFPLGAEQFARNARPDCGGAVPQASFGGCDRLTGGGDVEPSDRTGERVHMEVVFEGAARVRERKQAQIAARLTEATDPGRRDADGGHDLRQEFDRRDLTEVLPVGVEDEGEIIQEPDSIGRLLALRVEDGDPVLGRQEWFEHSELCGRARHMSRTRVRVSEERADGCLK